jgi:Calcineurin-like phosphoesterase
MYNTFSQSPPSSKISIPIIPTFGNNDIYPHNILYGGAKGKRVFEKFLDIWKPFIPKDQYETFLTGGYFAVDVVPNHLKVISLNTMYFYNSNAAVDSCSKKSSPGHRQLEWLRDKLHQAKKKETKVIIIGHIPPIHKAYYSSCYRQYSTLALQYDRVISGHLYGHLNMDHFLILGDDDATKHGNQDDEAILAGDIISINRNIPKYLKALRDSYRSVDYVNDGKAHHAAINISPSVIPEMNPTFRIFRYDADEKSSTVGDLLGYTQWYANLTHWNTHQPKHHADLELNLQGEAYALNTMKDYTKINNNDNADIPYLEYEVEYDTLNDYKMEDLSTDSWLSLARDLGGEGNTSEELWNNYTHRMFVQSKDVKDLARL